MASQKLRSFLEKQLFCAVLARDLNYVKGLVKFCKGTYRDSIGNTILHYYASAEITAILIQNTNVLLNINSQNALGMTPLHMWWFNISSKDFEMHYDIMKMLLEAGANCNHQHKQGGTVLESVIGRRMTLLMDLQENQWTALVQLLLSYNADAGIKNCRGKTPLHLAIEGQYVSIIRLLEKHGSPLNAQDCKGCTTLHTLVSDTHYYDDNTLKSAKRLLDNGVNPALQDHFGRTALHGAVFYGCQPLVLLLLKYEPSNSNSKTSNSFLHIKDKNGLNALHYAVGGNHIQIALILLIHGADANAVDKYGASCLHHAAYQGNADMVKCLKFYNGNPGLVDGNGNTPEIFALRRNNYSTVAALQVDAAKLKNNIKQITIPDPIPDNTISLQRYPCDENVYFPIFNLTANQSNHIPVETWDNLFQGKFHGDSQKFLKDLMKVQGIGKIPNVSEVKEIQQVIETYMDELTKSMAALDPRFKGEIFKSGSVYEGTKVGDPDEFDYMFILTEFEKICSIPSKCENYDNVSILKKEPNRIDAFEFEQFFEDNHLKCRSVMENFYNVCLQAIYEVNQKSLPGNFYIFNMTHKTRKGSVDLKSGITTCELGFLWCGAFYKFLRITADLVPAIRMKSWPSFAETRSKLLTSDIIRQGCHVVQKSDKWRLSFSSAEQAIMKGLPDNLRSAYLEAKVARDPKVTLDLIICEQGTEDWQNNLSGKPRIDGRKLLPSYLLKLVLFNCIDDCHKNGRDTSQITSATIFSKLHKCLQENIPVPFFFMKKHNFLDKVFNDERPKEHAALVVSVIDHFFKHKVK